MGLIRGGFVFFLGVLLFVSFLAMNTMATFSSSLSYENVKNGIYPVVQGIAESSLPEDITGNLNLTRIAQGENFKAANFCRVQNTTYNFSYEGFTVEIPCETVSLGIDSIINETISDVVYAVYYTEYDCKFWSCFSENQFPFFLISEKAKDYWKGKFYLALVASLVLVALIALLMENRINAPIILGILLALSAIPILKLSSLISAIAGQPISFVIGIFFSKAGTVFWIAFILGLLLIALGFAAKVMNLGFIKKLIQKKPEEKRSQAQASTQTSQPKTKKK